MLTVSFLTGHQGKQHHHVGGLGESMRRGGRLQMKKRTIHTFLLHSDFSYYFVWKMQSSCMSLNCITSSYVFIWFPSTGMFCLDMFWIVTLWINIFLCISCLCVEFMMYSVLHLTTGYYILVLLANVLFNIAVAHIFVLITGRLLTIWIMH